MNVTALCESVAECKVIWFHVRERLCQFSTLLLQLEVNGNKVLQFWHRFDTAQFQKDTALLPLLGAVRKKEAAHRHHHMLLLS